MSQEDFRDARCICATSIEKILCLHLGALISGSLFPLLWCEGNCSCWQEPVKGLFRSAFVAQGMIHFLWSSVHFHFLNALLPQVPGKQFSLLLSFVMFGLWYFKSSGSLGVGRKQVKKLPGDSSRPGLQVCKGLISLIWWLLPFLCFQTTQLSYTLVLNFLKEICFLVSCFHVDLLVSSRIAKMTLILFPQQGH